MQLTRRAILAGAAFGALPKGSDAAFAALPDVIADATYWSIEATWRLTLFANYSGRLNVELKKRTLGTVSGQLRFYDVEVAESHELAAFGRLSAEILPPEPDIHPSIYDIALLLPVSGGLHRVKVYMARSMPASTELRVFFTIWRNIWSGIPGAPLAPS